MKVLVVNPGSSTIKLSLWNGNKRTVTSTVPFHDRPDLLEKAISTSFSGISDSFPGAIGVRVVHGGPAFGNPVLAGEGILENLEALRPLSPLHTDGAIRTIKALKQTFPGCPIVLSFDTAFHRTLPAISSRYPVPEAWVRDHGVRRYGFHGLSYDYLSHRLKELFKPEKIERTVALHLGNGASACAIHSGISVDTTMGLTPMEGLMMGTRSGSIDPGIPFYLGTKGLSSGEIEQDLNHRSGLLGVSGLDSDLIILEKAFHSGHSAAGLALSMFVRKAAQSVSQMATSMGGLSCLVFSGGIGENSSLMREWICRDLGFLGVFLDSVKNGESLETSPDRVLSHAGSRVCVVVISAQEDWTISRDTHLVLGHSF